MCFIIPYKKWVQRRKKKCPSNTHLYQISINKFVIRLLPQEAQTRSAVQLSYYNQLFIYHQSIQPTAQCPGRILGILVKIPVFSQSGEFYTKIGTFPTFIKRLGYFPFHSEATESQLFFLG